MYNKILGVQKSLKLPLVFEYRAIDQKKFKLGIEYRDLKKEGSYRYLSKGWNRLTL